jgi:hypothetical protein
VSSPTPGPLGPPRLRSRVRRPRDGEPAPQPALRPPVRPLDDGTTELVRVIEFVLPAGSAIQPVLWLDRKLLD